MNTHIQGDQFRICNENDFIYNRFDLLYYDEYTCLQVESDDGIRFVPVYYEGETAHLGLWCYELQKPVFLRIVHTIFRDNRKIKKICFQNNPSEIDKKLLRNSNLVQRIHWKIVLPGTPEELDERLSSKKRYNIRREKRIAQQELGEYSILEYNCDTVPDDIIMTFFQFKSITHGADFHMTPKTFLEKYHVSNIYVLKFRDIIGSIVLSCEQGRHVYLDNLTYNTAYQKYSLGSILYDEYLKILCKKGKTSLYLGWGNYIYKSLYGAEEQHVYTGTLYRNRYQYLINGGFKELRKKLRHNLKRCDVLNLRRFIRKA